MEGHKPDGSVLKDLDSVRDSVITEAPSLASIANVRGKDSMVDIDKVRKRQSLEIAPFARRSLAETTATCCFQERCSSR